MEGDQPLLQELSEVEDAFQVAPPSLQRTKAPPSLQRTKAGLIQAPPSLQQTKAGLIQATDRYYWQAWQGSDEAAPPLAAFSVGESVCGLGWFSYPGPSSFGPDLDPVPDLVLDPEPDLEACCWPCSASLSPSVQAPLKREALCCSQYSFLTGRSCSAGTDWVDVQADLHPVDLSPADLVGAEPASDALLLHQNRVERWEAGGSLWRRELS